MEPGRLIVGRVVKPHGIRGEVSVDAVSEAPERFAPGARMKAGARDVVIESSRPHQGRLLIFFEGVSDRTVAEGLRGAVLTIGEDEAASLDEWSFYPHQLEGLDVVDEQGHRLGVMRRVDESPGGDLWVVDADGQDVLVPAVRAIIQSVDLDAGRITMSPPEGLFP